MYSADGPRPRPRASPPHRPAPGADARRSFARCGRALADNGEILDFLRGGFGRIDDRFDRIDQKLDEVVTQLGRLEREVAGFHADYAGLSVRLDNIDRRRQRVERRLDLVETPEGA